MTFHLHMFDAIRKRVFPLAAAAIAGALFLVAFPGCTSVPVTGRNSLDLVEDSDVTAKSKEAFEQLKGSQRISRDPKLNQQLQRVGDRIADVVFWDVPDAEWEFVVFDDPRQVNAFAMAGGKVGVYSGAFAVATTDDQLAVIVAHEIAHVTAKHVHEKLSQDMVKQAGGIVVGVASAGYGSLSAAAITSVYQMGSGVVGLGFNRAKEREADKVGLIYMSRAGYNPRAALKLWEKMDQVMSGQSVPPEWLSTHPSHTDRMARLYDWMPQAEKVYKRSAEVNS